MIYIYTTASTPYEVWKFAVLWGRVRADQRQSVKSVTLACALVASKSITRKNDAHLLNVCEGCLHKNYSFQCYHISAFVGPPWSIYRSFLKNRQKPSPYIYSLSFYEFKWDMNFWERKHLLILKYSCGLKWVKWPHKKRLQGLMSGDLDG
jgi:hypothetical protein